MGEGKGKRGGEGEIEAECLERKENRERWLSMKGSTEKKGKWKAVVG